MPKIRADKQRILRPKPLESTFLEAPEFALGSVPPQFELKAKGFDPETSQPQSDQEQSNEHASLGVDVKVAALQTQLLPTSKTKIQASDLPVLPKTGGRSIPGQQRVAYEQSLGVDLGDVRIFSSPEAAEAVTTLGAEAVTHGLDIYIKEPLQEGDPQSERMLAHELLHVKQFKMGKVPSSEGEAVSSPTDALEVEAYGQENNIAKQSLELRGESTDSPILNQTFTPPATAGREAGEGSEESMEFEAAEVKEEGFEEKARNENPTEGANAGDAPADEGSAPVVEAAAAEGESESPASVGPEAAPLPPVAETPAPQPLPNGDHSSIQGNGIETVPAAKVEGKAEKTADLKGEAARVQELARSRASALRASGASRLAAYRAKNQSTKAQLAQNAASAKQQVIAAYAAQKQALSAKAEAQLAAIEAGAAAQKAALVAFGAAELQRFTAGKEAELAQAAAAVEAKKAATTQAAADEAARARSESEADAQTILSEASGFPMGSEAEANDAKRKALTDIANDTAAKIRKNGSEVAANVQSEAGEFSKKYDEAHQEYLKGVEEEAANYVEKAADLGTSMNERIDQAANDARSAVEAARAQGQQALDQEQSNACTLIDQKLTQYNAQIDNAAAQVEGEFERQYTQSAGELDQYGQDCSAQLLKASAQDVAGVTAAVGQMTAQIDQFASSMESGLASWESKTNSELDGIGQAGASDFTQTVGTETERAGTIGAGIGTEMDNAAQTALDTVTKLVSDTQAAITAATDEVLGGLAQSRGDFEGKLETIYGEAKAKFQQFVNDGLQAGKDLLATARNKMQEAVSNIDSKYASLKAEAQTMNGQASARVMRGFWSWLGGVVESVGQWFKDTFGDWLGGFLFGLLQAIVIVLIGMAAMWVLGAILAACAVAAEVIAVVVLVVGLVVAIGFGIYNRWQEYKADHNGEGPSGWWVLGCIGLGILDITGIPFIVEGIVGTRATGGELSDFQRGERIAMGLVFLIAFGVSAAKALKGGGAKVPVDDPFKVPPVDDPIKVPVDDPGKVPVDEPGKVPVDDPGKVPVDEPGKVVQPEFAQIKDLVVQKSDGTFKLNRKKFPNYQKIQGEPEAVVHQDAAREAYAALIASEKGNVTKVYIGKEADALINSGKLGKAMSVDGVAVTREGKYILYEAKGKNIEHGLEQLKYSADKLGKESVIRYELVVPEELQPGYRVQNGVLQVMTETGAFVDYLINGHKIFVRQTSSN